MVVLEAIIGFYSQSSGYKKIKKLNFCGYISSY